MEVTLSVLPDVLQIIGCSAFRGHCGTHVDQRYENTNGGYIQQYYLEIRV